MLAAAENHAKAGDGGGELKILAGGVELLAPLLERELYQPALDAVGLFVAELEREQFAARRGFGKGLWFAGGSGGGESSRHSGLLILQRLDIGPRLFALLVLIDRNQLIQGGHRVPGPDFAGVLLVVVEVRGC